MLGRIVPIELGGKTRYLKYGFNALVELEEALGCGLQDFLGLLQGGAKLKDLRAILRAGLLHEDPALTDEAVGNLLDEAKDLSALGVAIKTAFEAAFPPPPADVKARVPGRKAGASKN